MQTRGLIFIWSRQQSAMESLSLWSQGSIRIANSNKIWVFMQWPVTSHDLNVLSNFGRLVGKSSPNCFKYIIWNLYLKNLIRKNITWTCNALWGAILFVEKVFEYCRRWWQSAPYLPVIGRSSSYGPLYFKDGIHREHMLILLNTKRNITHKYSTNLIFCHHFKWGDCEIDTTSHNLKHRYTASWTSKLQ